MDKILFSLAIIISGLLTGYLIRSLSVHGVIQLPMPLERLRKLLQNLGLLFFMPISFMAAVWVVNFDDSKILLLPLLGIGALVIGGAFGFGLASLLKSPPREKAVLFCCSSFTNLGSIGALVCYLFLGEVGFALVALYKMLEEIYYYTIGFPIARFIGGSVKGDNKKLIKKIATVLADPYVAIILLAFFTGLGLNLSGITRPLFVETVSSIFIPTGTFILIVSIGLGMRISKLREHIVTGIFITLIKSLLVPVVITATAWWLGLGAMQGGIPLMVVLILSSMPAAFNAIIAASVFELDLDMANSCWLISTMSLCLVIPWLYWLQGFLLP